MLIGMARLLLPVCLGIVVAAPLILRTFGPLYEGATSLLRLLVLSVIPYSVNVLYLGLARIRVNGPRIITVQAAIASLILGLSLVLIPTFGVDGIGVAFVVGQGAVAALLLATVLRPLLTSDGDPTSGRSDQMPSAGVGGAS
jgi:O-antigen/teichoic acid export membrane protein